MEEEFAIKLDPEAADESPEEPDYTEDAIQDAAGRVCAALDIDEAKAPDLVRTLRPLMQLLREEG